MRQSQALLYLYSQYFIKSRWMPWEIGFFGWHQRKDRDHPCDSRSGRAIQRRGIPSTFIRTWTGALTQGGTVKLWINRTRDEYASLYDWAMGTARDPREVN